MSLSLQPQALCEVVIQKLLIQKTEKNKLEKSLGSGSRNREIRTTRINFFFDHPRSRKTGSASLKNFHTCDTKSMDNEDS